MSSRPLLKPQAVLTAQSMAASFTSLITNVNMISILSYTLAWTGTPTGTFTVEVSNDYVPTQHGVLDPAANTGTWVALVLSVTVAATGADGSAFIDVDTMGAAWVRLKYTRDSGTGAATATIAGKCA